MATKKETLNATAPKTTAKSPKAKTETASAKTTALRIASLVPDSLNDGPGHRFTVNVQGCPHSCLGCNAPKTHDFLGGKEADVLDITKKLLKNPMLSGVTFSGGEPMCQASQLLPLASFVKECGLELAIYTGYTFEFLVAEANPDRLALLNLADTLIDGRFNLDEKSLMLKYKGSKNQRIIDLKATMPKGAAVLDTSDRWNRLGF